MLAVESTEPGCKVLWPRCSRAPTRMRSLRAPFEQWAETFARGRAPSASRTNLRPRAREEQADTSGLRIAGLRSRNSRSRCGNTSTGASPTGGDHRQGKGARQSMRHCWRIEKGYGVDRYRPARAVGGRVGVSAIRWCGITTCARCSRRSPCSPGANRAAAPTGSRNCSTH